MVWKWFWTSVIPIAITSLWAFGALTVNEKAFDAAEFLFILGNLLFVARIIVEDRLDNGYRAGIIACTILILAGISFVQCDFVEWRRSVAITAGLSAIDWSESVSSPASPATGSAPFAAPTTVAPRAERHKAFYSGRKITTKPKMPSPPDGSPALSRPNPLDPYDGTPNFKVIADALAVAQKLRSAYQPCWEGRAKRIKLDYERKDRYGGLFTTFMIQESQSMHARSDDLTNLEKSLIYRLGVSERNVNAERGLMELVGGNYRHFDCIFLSEVGDYFDILAHTLEATKDR